MVLAADVRPMFPASAAAYSRRVLRRAESAPARDRKHRRIGAYSSRRNCDSAAGVSRA